MSKNQSGYYNDIPFGGDLNQAEVGGLPTLNQLSCNLMNNQMNLGGYIQNCESAWAGVNSSQRGVKLGTEYSDSSCKKVMSERSLVNLPNTEAQLGSNKLVNSFENFCLCNYQLCHSSQPGGIKYPGMEMESSSVGQEVNKNSKKR